MCVAIITYTLLYTVPTVLYINRSPSVPPGLYVRTFSSELQYGDYVVFPSEDFIPDAPPMLLKKVYAMPPDFIEINDEGVFINDVWYCGIAEGYEPYTFFGRVPEGTFFAMTPHRKSYDSRYFGFVDQSIAQKVNLIRRFKRSSL